MPAKTKTKPKPKPKLIAKTPWLARCGSAHLGSWYGAGWVGVCNYYLSQLFHLPRRASAGIRLLCYDRKGKRDESQKLWFMLRNSQYIFWCDHSPHDDDEWGALSEEIEGILRRTLFRGCTKPRVKTAWLEIEIED